MDFSDFLSSLPIWGVFGVTIVATLVQVEIGFRLGRRESRQDVARESVAGLVAASLGLLAFMLAFTFGSVAARFDHRRQLVLDEANAIGTAYLRADLLPDEHGREIRRLLVEYVEFRMQAVETRDRALIMQAVQRSEEFHDLLWREVLASRDAGAHLIPWSLATQSLNEVFDLHQDRVTIVLHRRVPSAIWTVLYLLAGLAMVGAGYHVGLTGRRRPAVVFLTALAFSSVVLLINDLDRIGGMMLVGQESMFDLLETMQKSR